MAHDDFVFIGIDVVAEAIDAAEARRWIARRAPGELWQRLGVSTGALLTHPDAPISVVVAPADSSLRGAGRLNGRISLCHDPARFRAAVEDCPVVEDLVRALLHGVATASASQER